MFNKLTWLHSIVREALLRGKVSTVDLLIKIGCFIKKKNIFSVYRAMEID
jgi:hypothetical protein